MPHKKIAITLLFLLACFIAMPVHSQTGNTTIVIAAGTGKDEKSALDAALRAAVQQAVGTLIDAETWVKNDELVRDNILLHSAGFVERHERLGEPKKENGLVTVQIQAVVRRMQLTQEFERLGVRLPVGTKFKAPIDGEGLYAPVVTKDEADSTKNAIIDNANDRRNARAEKLEDVLQGYPESVLTAKLVSKPKYDEQKAQIVLDVLVAVDMEKYGQFVGNLNAVLRQVSERSTTKNFTAKKFSYKKEISLLKMGKFFQERAKSSPPCIAFARAWPIPNVSRELEAGKEFTVTYSVFDVGDAAYQIALKVAKRQVFLKIDLVDKNDATVLSTKLVSPAGVKLMVLSGGVINSRYGGIFFAPVLQQWASTFNNNCYGEWYNPATEWNTYPGTSAHVFTIRIDASPEDLREMKNIIMKFEAQDN